MATTKKAAQVGWFTSVQNFIRKALGLDQGVGAFGVILSGVLVLFGGVLILVLLGSSFGIGNAIFAHDEKHGSRVLGVLFLLIYIFWAWLNFSDRIPFKVSDMAFVFSLIIGLALIVLYNSGHLF